MLSNRIARCVRLVFGLLVARIAMSRVRKLRRLCAGVETLERRELLSGNNLLVTDVSVSGDNTPAVVDIVDIQKFDVNRDRKITAGDPLAVIVALNLSADPKGEGEAEINPADVSGDGKVTALDALLAINYINVNGAVQLPTITSVNQPLPGGVLGIWQSDIPLNLVTAKVVIQSEGINWDGQGGSYGSLVFELILRNQDTGDPFNLKPAGSKWVSPVDFHISKDGDVDAVNFGHRDATHRLPDVERSQVVFEGNNFKTSPGAWLQATLVTDYGSVAGPVIHW